MAYTSLTQPLILVTGASGNVGREVLKGLKPHTKEGSVRVRVGTRSDHGLDEGENVERVYFDFSERATYAAAVRGCQSLFLLRPPAVANTKETLNPLIDAAREAGVAQIVFLSVAGADKNRVVPHHAVEAHLQAGPLDWTILRPGFFAQNIGTAYRADVTEEHRLYLPAGGARVAFVDLRDVGEVAADALVAGERHRGKGYTLTGPEAFSFEEVADFLTAAAGRRVRYERASALGYARHLRRQGVKLEQVAVQTVIHVSLRFGGARTVDPTLRKLLNRPPLNVRDYIEDHAELWK